MARKTAVAPPAPLYKQLEQSFVEDIRCGRLKPGESVPSTYSLAEQFGISRVTAVRCYEQLKARGFLTAKRGGTTIVNPALTAAALSFQCAPDVSPITAVSEYDNCSVALAPRFQQPPPEVLPGKAWLKAMSAVIDEGLPEFCGPDAHRLTMRLKLAVTTFLIRSRGMSLYPRNILLFDSKYDALAFVGRNFAESGSGAAVESPGDPLLHDVFRRHSSQLFGLPVDREGAVIEHLEPGSGVKIVAVSPSAHFPSGVVLSERRRQQVARFAGHNDALLLEDDTAALIRYGKQPEPCLFNKFKNAIQVGSFGAYLGPLCRISYLVVPDRLLERVQGCARETFSQPRLETLVLSHLIETGALDLAIFKMRAQLDRSRQQLLSRLQLDFKGLLAIGAGSTGFVQMVRVHSNFPREAICAAVDNCGLISNTVRNFYLEQRENSRVELLLPLCDYESTIEKLSALKQQLDPAPLFVAPLFSPLPLSLPFSS